MRHCRWPDCPRLVHPSAGRCWCWSHWLKIESATFDRPPRLQPDLTATLQSFAGRADGTCDEAKLGAYCSALLESRTLPAEGIVRMYLAMGLGKTVPA